jgi:stress response protein YsnF
MSENLPEFDREDLENFVQEYMELDRRIQRPKDIYSVLRGPRERKYQYTLRYFRGRKESHLCYFFCIVDSMYIVEIP